MTTCLTITFHILFITVTFGQIYRIPIIKSKDPQYIPTISFGVNLGNPQQQLTVFLHSSLKDLIVVDLECGKPIEHCPRYCSNIEFSKYCNPLCHITIQSYPLICWKEKNMDLYASNKSSTYKPVKGKEWNHKLTVTRPLYGKYGKDALKIKGFDSNLTANDFEFVKGLSLDSRMVLAQNEVSNIFGISPANDTIIQRLYNQRLIEAPILSVSLHNYQLTIGAEDNKHCRNWHSHPIVDQNSWVFEVEFIKMSGIGEFNNIRVMSMPEWPFIQVPKSVTDKLLLDNVITLDFQDLFFVVNCTFKMSLEFKFKDQTLYFDQTDVIAEYPDDFNNTLCYAMMSTSEISPYNAYPEWRLGTGFFKKYCHSYNFEDRTISFGENVE